jgi:hypothetical protein
MKKLAATLLTLSAIGSLVSFSSPAFACGDEKDEDEDEPSAQYLSSAQYQPSAQCGDEGEKDDEDES